MFGLEVGLIIKAVLALLTATGVLLAIRKYGKLIGTRERHKAIEEVTKINDENFKELADDVLDGGHPYGVRKPGATEVAYPELDARVRVAPDVQGEQAGGHRRNGADTS